MSTNRAFRAPGGLYLSLLFCAATAAAPAVSAARPETPRQQQVPQRRPRPAAPAGSAAAPLRPQALAAHEYLPTGKLRPGMKGYGLTIFRGTKIERFGVTILGVVRKINNGKDLILVRLDGGPVTRRNANIIRGMSGSPVYVNGRIVGAVAYGNAFAREPLGYLTPIEDMLEAWDPDLPQSLQATASAAAALTPRAGDEVTLPAAVTVGGRRFTRARFAAPGAFDAGRGGVASDGVLTLVPLMTPVSVSGVPASQMPRLVERFAALGLALSPAQNGGGAAALPPNAKGSAMVPGGAVGVSLATGDFDFTGFGTVTYRRGDKIVAFGHPFFGIGPIDAAMYSAYIQDVFPSYNVSDKIGSPVSLVGRVFQDRPFSIGGQIGAPPRMVPVAIDIDDRTTKRRRQFRARIMRHPLLTPLLASTAASSAITEVHGQPGDAMATVSLQVDAEEVGRITRTNTFFDPISIGDSAIGDLDALLSTLTSNPFYPLGVRDVKMKVLIEPRRDTAQVERIFLKQSRFEPGDTVDVGVILKPYKRERIVRNLSVRIPASAPSGSLTLLVQGGGAAAPMGLMPGGAGGGLVLRQGIDPSSVGSVQQLVRRFMEKEKNNDLVARLMLPTTAITVQGEKLSNLPPTIGDVMRATRSTGLRVERDEVKVVEPTRFVLSGAQAITIRVAKKSLAAPERPAVPSSPAAPDAGGPSLGSPAPGGLPTAATDDGDVDVAASPLLEPLSTPQAPPPPPAAGDTKPAAAPKAAAPAAAAAKPAPGDEGEDDDTPASPPKETPGGEATKPVGRLPALWQQTTAVDFRAGTLKGVTVTSRGDVRLAPTLAKVNESNEAYFWALAPAADDGTAVFAGTGDNGLIYRIAADGTRTEFARTGELQVHALARAADGALYAGTSPNGRVLRIGADGKPVRWFQTEEKYVLALAVAPDGVVYAATGGGKGRIYRITADGKGTIVHDGNESHITALAMGGDGTLYAGTAPNGIVLKAAGPGVTRATVLYDANEPAISGLGVDKAGNVFAATAGGSGRGLVYKIAVDGASVRVAHDKSPGAIAGLQVAPDGTVWFASGATVYALAPDGETVQTFDAASDIQILSLLLGPEGKLWASTGNVGGVYALGGGGGGPRSAGAAAPATSAVEGTLTSSVFDAKAAARWGTIRWTGTLPAGSRILLQTRSGDVAEPDATWSDWSRGYADPAGEKIASPPGRYLQYRATLAGGGVPADGRGPALRTVEAFYLTRNQPPTVAIAVPRGGEVWRGAKTLRWTGADPDKDTLSYEVSLSSDGGKTWKPVRAAGGGGAGAAPARRVPPAPPAATPVAFVEEAAAGNGDEGPTLAEVQAELDKHPEIPAEIKARILTEAPAAIREAIAASRQATAGRAAPAAAAPGAAGGGNNGGGTRDTSAPIDTTKWPDGTYLLRVVASDAAANPVDGQSAERVSNEFRIVNRPPTLLLFPKATTVRSDRSVRVEGMAMHPQVAVRAVQFRVDNGEWVAGAATDGLFDTGMETFTLTTPPLAAGAHTIEVQAQDEAGNPVTQKTTVTVR